ncbi:hypothetical protein [Desulfoferrobacter suflitae]|uniref:hypothetical protein n=1 Tax=Desulfoferrobacter suflitae TaxID=2865782 RepID=UPI0021643AB4|nr:hypothetical protein [Desulfoferrobacter suflitae]MCK8604151.1 hypothetical protein [Desulfoferrobacter suflitae]
MTVTWIKIAALNLLRNRRRSLFTIIAIAMGYAAVNVFGGFTGYIFRCLKDSFIYAQANGHITIFKEGFLQEGQIEPLKFLIDADQARTIHSLCRSNPHIVVTTGQLSIMGLVTNGSVSTIFIASGKVPSDTYQIQRAATGILARIEHLYGKPLDDSVPYGIGMAFGLAKRLKLEVGSDAIVMASTVDGRINALDAQVFQLFYTILEELNDKYLIVPLSLPNRFMPPTALTG